MKAKHTLKKIGITKKENGIMQSYSLCDGEENLLATVVQKTQDENIHQVLWYGGDNHGKSDLVEGGTKGVMDFVANKLN